MFINNSIKKGILVSVIASSIVLFTGCSNTKKPSKPFITVWNVMIDKNIRIPINPDYAGNYNYTVNWGDGSISKNVHKSITHTYAKYGKYTVKISGTFPAIYLNGSIFSDYLGNPSKLIEIKQWGNIKWKSFQNSFAGARNLKIIAKDIPNLKNVKDMSDAFTADNTNTFNNINNWDVSNVTNMEGMFSFTKSFNQPLDNWDVSHVTDMNGMFQDAEAFNQPLDKWDVSHVANMYKMFNDAEAFNQPLDNWDVSHVTNMNGMFKGAKSFNQPLDKWDVSNVTNMSDMFYYAIKFNQNISNWNVSNVTDYESFAGKGCLINGTSKMPKFK